LITVDRSSPTAATDSTTAAIALVNRINKLVMPAIGSAYHADLEAKACVELGFLWWLAQPRKVAPPSHFYGSSGYPLWYCKLQLARIHKGEAFKVT
jgi:hypothetical protein